MLEKRGDIFQQQDADAICFTSNTVVKANGELVMGAGIALSFKKLWPHLPKFFGQLTKLHGGHVQCFKQRLANHKDVFIVSFPTKNRWQNPSDIKLIAQSTQELVEMADKMLWQKVYLPRPGCALGMLSWEKDVKPLIAPMLDDRFIVITL